VFFADTLSQINNIEVDMHKVLQAIVDTFLLAAGSVEFGSTAHSSVHPTQGMPRRGATRSSPGRTPTAEQISRTKSQSFASKQALRPTAEESRP
jgi:hypothetical protein